MKNKQIFVIGRMGDHQIGRLNRLAFDIIEPLVEPLGYTVHTPNRTGSQNIMNNVVEMLETAEIVVADITAGEGERGVSSANVLYELGIRHCFGSPFVVVTETPNRVPFDIQGHRYCAIDLDDPSGTSQKLKAEISDALECVGTYDNSNPVVDYYGESLTSISPAVGIALGYFYNFIRPAINRLTQLKSDQSGYEYDVVLRDSNRSNAAILESCGTDFASRRTLKIHIPIPPRLALMESASLNEVVATELKHGAIQSSPRPFTLYLRKTSSTGLQIFDFPRPLTAIRLAIEGRLGARAFGTDRWLELEEKEIQLFCSELRRYINHIHMQPAHRRHVQIHHYGKDDPSEQFDWLDQYWGA